MKKLQTTPKLPIEKIKRFAEVCVQRKAINDEYDVLREDLLKLTQALDVYNLKTGSYTLYRSRRVTPQVVDFDTLEATLKAENIPYKTKTVFDEYTFGMFQEAIKQGRKLAGLGEKITEFITLRTKEVTK